MKQSIAFTLVFIGLLASPLPAQEQPEGKEGRGLRALRRGDRGGNELAALIERIRAELNLDEKQQAEFDRIVKQQRREAAPGKGLKAQRSLMRELREAREANDQERVAELRRKLAESRRAAGASPALRLLDALEQADFLREDQLARLARIRERVARAERRRGTPGGRVLAEVDRLRSELKLSAEQAERFDELYARLEEELRPPRADSPEVQRIIDELVEAAEAGDMERVKQLRERLPNPQRAGEQALVRFLDELEPILEPEQVQTLERFRQRVGSRQTGHRLELMFRIVRRLDLDADQRQQVRELERETRRAMRELRRKPAELARLATEVEVELRGLLTAEQAAEFDRWLERQRPERERKGDRPGARRERRERSRRQTQEAEQP